MMVFNALLTNNIYVDYVIIFSIFSFFVSLISFALYGPKLLIIFLITLEFMYLSINLLLLFFYLYLDIHFVGVWLFLILVISAAESVIGLTLFVNLLNDD